MAKQRALVNKLKRRKNYLNRNKGHRRQDKVDRQDEILAGSPGVYKLMRKIDRRADRNFGIQSLPSPDGAQLESLINLDDVDRFDFDPGAGTDFGIRMRRDVDVMAEAEEFTISVPATASAGQADYFHFIAPNGDSYAVWLDIDAADMPPTGAVYLAADQQVEVDIVALATAATNAAAVVLALGPVTDMTITDNLDGTITFAYDDTGSRQDAVTYNEDDSTDGSLVATIDNQGVDGVDDPMFQTVGLRVGDVVEFLTGALKGVRLAVVELIDDNTIRLEDHALAAPETNVKVKCRLSGSKKSYV